MDLFEQIRGMADCREGLPPRSNNESYLSGYNIEFQMTEINRINKGKDSELKRPTEAANH